MNITCWDQMTKLRDVVSMVLEDEQKRKHITCFLILNNSTEALLQFVIMTSLALFNTILQLVLLYVNKCKGHSDIRLTKLT